MKDMRLLLGVLLLAGGLGAQMKLTVRQLVSFVKSSVDLRHDDKKVAQYLKQVTLTQRLDDSTLTELQAAGIGPRTTEALIVLRDLSRSLIPAPAPDASAPKATLEPPPPSEQRRALADAREYALNYIRRLPDFLCTQVTRRYIDPSGLEFWQRDDVITARLSFFEQKENYQVVLVNSRPVDVPMERLGGAISVGEFGSMMKELFDPEVQAQFEWTKWATLRGRRMHVYAYRVPLAKSKLTIGYERTHHITVGYRGFVYIDRDTRTVARITQEGEAIPASFPIQQVSRILDYDLIPIGEAQFMLPMKFTTRMRQAKLLVKNEVEFRMYRKFGAEAVIKFDETPEPLPEEKTKEQPPQ
jgi:hypothetical protein